MTRRSSLGLLGLLLVFLPLEPAPAVPPPQVRLQSPLKLLPTAHLLDLLRRDDLCWSQAYGDGSIRQFSIAILIRAPLPKVWSRLCDYEQHSRWVPGLERSRVLRRLSDGLILLREFEVPGNNPEFRYQLRHRPKRLIETALVDGDGILKLGRWRLELLPVDQGRHTLIVQDGHVMVESSSAWQKAMGSADGQAQWLQQASEGLGYLQAIRRVCEN